MAAAVFDLVVSQFSVLKVAISKAFTDENVQWEERGSKRNLKGCSNETQHIFQCRLALWEFAG